MSVCKKVMTVYMCLPYLPVMRAVPSKFHLPAKTAPLWASTLFSIRPIFEARWNFPVKKQTSTVRQFHTLMLMMDFKTYNAKANNMLSYGRISAVKKKKK